VIFLLGGTYITHCLKKKTENVFVHLDECRHWKLLCPNGTHKEHKVLSCLLVTTYFRLQYITLSFRPLSPTLLERYISRSVTPFWTCSFTFTSASWMLTFQTDTHS